MWLRPLLVAAEVANLRKDLQVAVSAAGAASASTATAKSNSQSVVAEEGRRRRDAFAILDTKAETCQSGTELDLAECAAAQAELKPAWRLQNQDGADYTTEWPKGCFMRIDGEHGGFFFNTGGTADSGVNGLARRVCGSLFLKVATGSCTMGYYTCSGSLGGGGRQACEDKCKADQQCKAFTYAERADPSNDCGSGGGQTCWLHNAYNTAGNSETIRDCWSLERPPNYWASNAKMITKARNMLIDYNSHAIKTHGKIEAEWNAKYHDQAQRLEASLMAQEGQRAINEVKLQHGIDTFKGNDKELPVIMKKAKDLVLKNSKEMEKEVNDKEKEYLTATNSHDLEFLAKYAQHKEKIADDQNKETMQLHEWAKFTDKALLDAVADAENAERRNGIRYKKATQSHEFGIAKTEKKLTHTMDLAEFEADKAYEAFDWVADENEKLVDGTDVARPGLVYQEDLFNENLAHAAEMGEDEVKYLAEKGGYTVEDMRDLIADKHDDVQDQVIGQIHDLATKTKEAIEVPRVLLSDVEQASFQPFKELEKLIEILAKKGDDTNKMITETTGKLDLLHASTDSALDALQTSQHKKLAEWTEIGHDQITKRQKQLDKIIKAMEQRTLKGAENLFADKESKVMGDVRKSQQAFTAAVSTFGVTIRSMEAGKEDIVTKVKKVSSQVKKMQQALKEIKNLKLPLSKLETQASSAFTKGESMKTLSEHNAETKVKSDLALARSVSSTDLEEVMANLRGKLEQYSKEFNERELQQQEALESLSDQWAQHLNDVRTRQTVSHDVINGRKSAVSTVLHQLTFLPGQMQEASRVMMDLLKQQTMRIDQFATDFQPELARHFEEAVEAANKQFEMAGEDANNALMRMRDGAEQAFEKCEETQKGLSLLLEQNQQKAEAPREGLKATIHKHVGDMEDFRTHFVDEAKDIQRRLDGIERSLRIARGSADASFRKIREKMLDELKVIFAHAHDEMRTTVEGYQNKISEGLFEYGQKASDLKLQLENMAMQDKVAFGNMMKDVQKRINDGDGTLHGLVDQTARVGHDGPVALAMQNANTGLFRANAAAEGLRGAERHMADEVEQMKSRLDSSFAAGNKVGNSMREKLMHHVGLALEHVGVLAEQQKRKQDLVLGRADQAISHNTGGLDTGLKHINLDMQNKEKLVQTDLKNSLGVLKVEESKVQSALMTDKLKIQRSVSMAAEREHAAAGENQITASVTAQQSNDITRNAAKLENKVLHSLASLDPAERSKVLEAALLSFKSDEEALLIYEQHATQDAKDKAESLADAVQRALGASVEQIHELDPRVHEREVQAQQQLHALAGEQEDHRVEISHVQNDANGVTFNIMQNLHAEHLGLERKLQEVKGDIQQAAKMAQYADGDAMKKVQDGLDASLNQTQQLIDAAKQATDSTDNMRNRVQQVLANMGVKLDLDAIEEATNQTMEEAASVEDRLKAARSKLEAAVRQHTRVASWELRQAQDKAAKEIEAISRLQHLDAKERQRRIEQVRMKANQAREMILTRCRTAIGSAMKSGHTIDEKNQEAANMLLRSDQLARGSNGILATVDRLEQIQHDEGKLADTHVGIINRFLSKDGKASAAAEAVASKAGKLSLFQHYEDTTQHDAVAHPMPEAADVGQQADVPYAPPLTMVNGQYVLTEAAPPPPTTDQALTAALGGFARAPRDHLGFTPQPTSFAEVGEGALALSREDLAYVTQDVAWALHPSLPTQAADAWRTVREKLAAEAKHAEERTGQWQHTLEELR